MKPIWRNSGCFVEVGVEVSVRVEPSGEPETLETEKKKPTRKPPSIPTCVDDGVRNVQEIG